MIKLTPAQRIALEQAASVEPGFCFHIQYGDQPPGSANLRVLRNLTAKGLLRTSQEYSVSGGYHHHFWHITDAGREALKETP